MSRRSVTPLFVDTSAFYARFVDNAQRHDAARAVFDGIQSGALPYRPLVTSNYVVSETATLLLRKASHIAASEAVDHIRESRLIRVVHPEETAFEAICRSFDRFDDQQISFVDHSTAVLSSQRDIDHVFAFDDDFRTFGFTLVPDDTGEGNQ
jgi:predicted nucleic acid-binding protein